MRHISFPLLASALLVAAADWRYTEFPPEQMERHYYVDAETIQTSGSHKLAWVKKLLVECQQPSPEIKQWTCHYPQGFTESPYFLESREYDCSGRYLVHQALSYDEGAKKFRPGGIVENQGEWKNILPDTYERAIEKSICGK